MLTAANQQLAEAHEASRSQEAEIQALRDELNRAKVRKRIKRKKEKKTQIVGNRNGSSWCYVGILSGVRTPRRYWDKCLCACSRKKRKILSAFSMCRRPSACSSCLFASLCQSITQVYNHSRRSLYLDLSLSIFLSRFFIVSSSPFLVSFWPPSVFINLFLSFVSFSSCRTSWQICSTKKERMIVLKFFKRQ